MKTFAYTFVILAAIAILIVICIVIHERIINRNKINKHGIRTYPSPVKDYFIILGVFLLLAFALAAGVAKFILYFNFLERFGS
jgi:hypothetical protein